MKKIKSYKILTIWVLLSMALVSCNEPEVIPLLVYNGQATHTIEQLYEMYTLGTVPATYIEDSIIISGIVTSTDEFGSCYKEIYIQDSTGGISIRTANSTYFNKYRVGQRVFVLCKGLSLGCYISNSGNTGWYQLGLWGNGEMQYLPTNMENRHIFRSGYTLPEPTPKTVTSTSDLIENDFHTLVQLVNCEFVDANGSNLYFDSSQGYSAINRNIKLQSGNQQIIARISQYNNWGDTILPSGKLNIKGILSKYGSDVQLVIRSINDVQVLPPPGGTVVFQYDMQTSPFTQGWTTTSVQGSNVWTYNSGFKLVQMSGSTSGTTESWFVSPALNFGAYRNITLFFTNNNFNGIANASNFQLQYTTNGSTWTPLTISPFPSTSTFTETSVAFPDAAISNPNFKIAFKYVDDTNSSWSISNIQFKSNAN
jgi:hypothetical protein